MILGDCLEELQKITECTIDALITDPPAGISFMGKEWDSNKGGRDQWITWLTEVASECLRVMKPGAHGFVWALPRTSHWTATALENAGFEVRDIVTHLFGTGFPKSLDVSKAIDKATGVERTEGAREWRGGKRSSNKLGGGSGQENGTTTLIKYDTPATSLAKQWEGWGTALKPASEHWILIRKPCSEKTVAKNVARWGTGGINIDASRIEATDQDQLVKNWDRETRADIRGGNFKTSKAAGLLNRWPAPKGRFPANLIIDEAAAELLDEQSLAGGMHSAGQKRKPGTAKQDAANSLFLADKGSPNNGIRFGDIGGASRFFYVAKASKSERGDGNNHPTVKALKLMEYLIRMITPPGGVVLDPFMGSGSTAVAAKNLGFQFIGIEKQAEYFEIAEARCSL